VRDRGPRLPGPGQPGRLPARQADVRAAGPPGPGRRGPLGRPPRRPRHAAALDHRPGHRPAADDQRGPLGVAGLQRPDLQLPGAARAAPRPWPPLRHPERHRDDRSRLRGVGRGLRRPPAGHVRLRPVGCAARAALPGARPTRHQAALLRGRRAAALLRLRAEGPPGGPRGPAPARPRGPRRLPDLRVRRRRQDDLQGDPEAPAGPRPRSRGRARADPPVLGRAGRGRGGAGRGLVLPLDPGDAGGGRADPPPERGAPRGPPERRDRLVRGPRPRPATHGSADPGLHADLRRRALRRVRARARPGRALGGELPSDPGDPGSGR